MKTQVYSWRVSPALKAELERAARLRKVRVSTVLDMTARDWLAKNAADIAGDVEQKRLHASVERFFGVFSFGKRRDSKAVRETVRKRLARKYVR